MSDLGEAREKINALKLSSYLFENSLINSGTSDLEIFQYTNGYSNLTYLIKADDKEFVLRRPPKGAIKRGHDMGREYKVLTNLSRHFNKAPKTYIYEETGEVIGSTFYLMEKIEGVVINLAMAKKRTLSPSDFEMIYNSWLNTFVEFHQLDYKDVGLGDLGKPDGYIERQVKNWGKQYLKAATKDIPAATFVARWMEENMPTEYQHTLIHNDYKYDNLVFQDEDWCQINAILDWEMCTVGDPLMDLGTALAYWVMDNDGPMFTHTIPSATILPGNPSRSEIVHAYANRSGRNIDNLVFYYAFGLFKIAVIAQQIYFRYNKGLTSNPKFAKLDQVCKFLFETAQQAIDKKRIDNLY